MRPQVYKIRKSKIFKKHSKIQNFHKGRLKIPEQKVESSSLPVQLVESAHLISRILIPPKHFLIMNLKLMKKNKKKKVTLNKILNQLHKFHPSIDFQIVVLKIKVIN